MTAILACGLLLAVPQETGGTGWPQWRGPRRDGTTAERIARWPPARLWERDVGSGVSSAVARDGRVWVMGHADGLDRVSCLDAESGSHLWQHAYACPDDRTSDVRLPGPRSTPATDGEALFTMSLAGHLHALDARTGRLLWKKDPVETGSSQKQQYGVCFSPLLFREMVICDVADRCAAYDRATGRELWRAAGGGGWNGAAPVPARLGGSDAVVYGTGRALDAATGRAAWVRRPLPWPTVIAAGGRLLVQTLTGELILAEASPAGFRELGRFQALDGPCWTIPALAEGRLFCRNNRGRLVCLDVSGSGRPEAAGPPPEPVPPAPPTAPPPDGPPPPAPEGPTTEWPRFRGPDGAGHAPSARVPPRWNGKTGEGLLWKAPVPRRGYSSPVVLENRVFLTGAEGRTQEVFAFDAGSGSLLWRRDLPGAPAGGEFWKEPSRASPTSATDGHYLFCLFAGGDVAALLMETGEVAWTSSLGVPDNRYGHASSPVLHEHRLLLQIDQGEAKEGKSRLVALDIFAGRKLWERPRPVGAGWSTPLAIASGGRPQIVTTGNPWVIAYNPRDGAELWRANCLEGGLYAVPSPVSAAGLVFAVSDGAVLAALRPDGKGDVSRTLIAWTADEDLPSVPSPATDGKRLYVLSSDGTLSCREAAGGRLRWRRELGAGNRSFEASPLVVLGHVLCLDDAGGRLYIRGRAHLYCIGAPESK